MKTLRLLLVTTLICSLLCGCYGRNVKSTEFHIEEDLIDVYLIDDNIEKKLYNFFDTAETSYREYKKDYDTYKFIQTVYDAFDSFSEDLNSNANFNARIEANREANGHLASYSIDFLIASEPMLSLPLEYYENPDSVDETDVLSAVNSISQFFCKVDIFATTD